MNQTAQRKPMFFYGLFMDMAALRARGLTPRGEQLVEVCDHVVRLGAKAILVNAPGYYGSGMLAEISQTDFNALYAHQPDYIEIAVTVRTQRGDLLAASTMVHADLPLNATPDTVFAGQWLCLLRRLGIHPPCREAP